MDKRANPFTAPANQNHHVDGSASNYPFKKLEVRAKVRIGFEPWPLNMAGTTLVWIARWSCAVLYYFLFTSNASNGLTFFDQVRASWAITGEGSFMIKFMMTGFFVIPFMFLVMMVPGALMRTRLFTLPDTPPPPRREWWHWLVGK